jgi:hypothetical protein
MQTKLVLNLTSQDIPHNGVDAHLPLVEVLDDGVDGAVLRLIGSGVRAVRGEGLVPGGGVASGGVASGGAAVDGAAGRVRAAHGPGAARGSIQTKRGAATTGHLTSLGGATPWGGVPPSQALLARHEKRVPLRGSDPEPPTRGRSSTRLGTPSCAAMPEHRNLVRGSDGARGGQPPPRSSCVKASIPCRESFVKRVYLGYHLGNNGKIWDIWWRMTNPEGCSSGKPALRAWLTVVLVRSAICWLVAAPAGGVVRGMRSAARGVWRDGHR